MNMGAADGCELRDGKLTHGVYYSCGKMQKGQLSNLFRVYLRQRKRYNSH